MDINLIKKELYKQKPIAEFGFNDGEFKHYSCELEIDGSIEEITFKIPLQDCAETLTNEVEAYLLIRWINYGN